MKQNWKLCLLMCVAIMLPAVLAACGNKTNGDEASATPGAEDNSPYEITMMLPLSGDLPPDNNAVETKIEKYTNTDLNIQWSPVASYDDKVNVTIASGEMPMIIASPGAMTSSIQNAMKSGVFWELGALIHSGDYPKLAAINPIVYENESVEGKVYGIPQARPLSRNSILFRKDWLDKLSLKQPGNLDDLYAALSAFATKDPDGNGKNDTIGVSDNKDMTLFYQIAEASGVPNKWKVGDDGKLVPDFMTPEYLNAMNYYKRLYDEKLINSDFAATQNAQAKNLFFNGKAGMFPAVAGTATGAQLAFDKAKSGGMAGVIPRMQDPNGQTVKYADPGYNRLLLIPKSSVATEADVKKILSFYEHLGDDEMMMLLRFGIEGVHYEMKDGKPVYTDLEGYKQLTNEIQSNLKALDFTDEVNQYLDPLDLQAQQIFDENEKYTIANPALSLISPTYTEMGSELDTLIKDARTKFIMGELDAQGWQKQIDSWLSRGGQKIIDEYSADYAQSAANSAK